MLGFGTRDTVTTFPLTPALRDQLRREVGPDALVLAGAVLVLLVAIRILNLPAPGAIALLCWFAIIVAPVVLGIAGPFLLRAGTDLRSGVYVRRSGAIGTASTTPKGQGGGVTQHWLTMMGWRYAIPRGLRDTLRDVPYAVIEHTPSGSLLRVRDFDGHLLFQRWPDCPFPSQAGEAAGAPPPDADAAPPKG